MKKLQECKSIQEAQPLLRGSTPTFRKTVETAFALMGHQDPAQRAIGQGFLSTAIQEVDAAEEPTPAQGKFIKPKGEKFVHEAELKDGDKSGNEGSEQSSSNSGPLPKEGTEEPVGDLEAPEMKTEDQMKEVGGFPPMMPGLDPQLAQQMAPNMPQIPPMNTPQQIQQMQYTVKKYMEAYVTPLREQITQQNKAIKFLSNQVKEAQTAPLGLDLHTAREQTPKIQETELPRTVNNLDSQTGSPRIFEKQYSLEAKRQSILELDKLISNSPYQ
jgi:hypothetical protein